MRPAGLAKAGYSDVTLTIGVVAVIALMIWPLPLLLIDALVAVSMCVGVALLLIGIYIPSPIAFPSFPSVLLLTTLFRLALSIAITRQILLNADGGHIIETFGLTVAGGNVVVGLVVFLIITVVQFIVIAKGAERVAEVAARFSLDAMPGQQLSIDSDLRSGLIDKDEARRRRSELSLQSKLHGSLDGAMKFVKGDAIAGIVIIVINLAAGLAIGVMQRGMELADAARTYSILTIGDGLVAQIPALLSSTAAGLIVTRTAADKRDKHLGEAIGRQLMAQPRVILVTGVVALIMMLIPGFPTAVFAALGLALIGWSMWRMRYDVPWVQRALRLPEPDPFAEAAKPDQKYLALPAGLLVRFDSTIIERASATQLRHEASAAVAELRAGYGVPLPQPVMSPTDALDQDRFELHAYGVRVATGTLSAEGGAATQLAAEITTALKRHLGEFLGVQEASNLYTELSGSYPDLVKETLRAVPPQKLSDVLKRLVEEDVSIRDLRAVFECIAEVGAREKDVIALTEGVRAGLRRQLSARYAGEDRTMHALFLSPEWEEELVNGVRVTSSGPQLALDPKFAESVLEAVAEALAHPSPAVPVLLCRQDARRHVRKLLEVRFWELPVLSFQELTPDLQVVQVATLGPDTRRLQSVATEAV